MILIDLNNGCTARTYLMQGSWKIKYTPCYTDIKIYARQVKIWRGDGVPIAVLSMRKIPMLIAASFLY